jgi:D-glycero-D-manno-heptose 1,7-bisphosphate phosphatase
VVKTGVILAGGFGTRLAPVTNFKHKCLVFFEDKTILELQINQLLELGMDRVFILTGHLSNQIKTFTTAKYDERNVIILESSPDFSTRERLLNYRNIIGTEFILLYCDNYVNNLETIQTLLSTDASVVFLLNFRAEGNIEITDDDFVKFHDVGRSNEFNFVELGYLKIKNESFFRILEQNSSLTKAYEILTKESKCRYLIQEIDYLSLSNLQNYLNKNLKKNIILLDRDGIINHKMPHREYVSRMEEFQYIEENIEVLQILSSHGFKFIVITNQPGVSLGSVSSIFLQKLHEKITNDLCLLGIDIISIYTCIHHWEDNCKCRKPKPGMINKAMFDFRILPEDTCYIGDEEKDVQAASAAKIRGISISKSAQKSEHTFESLKNALPYLLNTFKRI